MSVFFDSNVVVYALDPGEPAKRAIAEALIVQHAHAGRLVTSTQVMQETFNTLTRKKRLDAARALDFVRLLAMHRVIGSSAQFVVHALDLSLRARLSVWDALIVQAALDAGCTTLLSEDLQAGQRFDTLEVVNPFAPAVHETAAAYAHPRRGGVKPAARRTR